MCLAALAAAQTPAVDEQQLEALRLPATNEGLVAFLQDDKRREGNGDAVALAARVLAQRHAGAALEVLLDVAATAPEAWLEDELLAALGRLALVQGKVDPRLLQALAGPPPRRAVAAYVLGRYGPLEERPRVRELLGDADTLVRRRAAEGLAGKAAFDSVRDMAALDEALLRQHKVEPVEPALLEFLRKRTLDDTDQKRLHQLVRELGSPLYGERERAARILIDEGTSALAILRSAEQDADLEIVRRARHCSDMIRRGPGPALPASVVRLLARPGTAAPAALRVLLGYLPFADDDTVEDAVLASAMLLAVREPKLDPCLAEALHDPLAPRRGAAAYLLGHLGGPAHHDALRQLAADAAPLVRLRAAQGLLAARDAIGIAHLIALLGELPSTALWRAEDLLCRLAGDEAPVESAAGAGRLKGMAAWEQWWRRKGPQIDLARLAAPSAFLGLVTVAEYDTALAQAGGRIWEGGRDGKQRWQLKGVQGAMDAQVLPNGRVLVAENSALRVTERDLDGNIVWEHRLQGNPICCQRLPNGNTFIGLYNQVLEVRPNHEEVYRHTPGPQFYIFSAHKSRKGTIVALTAQGAVIELDAQTGGQIGKPLQVGANGNWCGIETLPNGNYLVALLSAHEVREVTPQGNIVWQAKYQGVFRATRLPNGHTLVASMTQRRVAELDRHGNVRWDHACEGRPWSVHYR